MRFMVMHKMTAEMEAGAPPDAAILEGVGTLVGEAAGRGIFVSGEGLKPSSERMRIAYQGGRRTITRGPFSAPRELIAGFALLRVRAQEDAIAWCDRWAAAVGDMELVLGAVNEPWDIGMGDKPQDAPLRFLLLQMADEHSENDAPADPKVTARLSAVTDAMTAAGVLQARGGLASTRHGARIRFDAGKRTVMDGPFAESKELVAGYAILELPSKAEAIEWAVRFGEIVRVQEVDVRRVAD